MGYRHRLSTVLVALAICVAATAVAAARARDNERGGTFTSAELQAAIMSFADSWSSHLGEATAHLATQMVTPQARYQVDLFRLWATTAAIDIAASPYPGVALLDMLVLVTLTRMVWEEHWMPHVYGQSAVGLVT